MTPIQQPQTFNKTDFGRNRRGCRFRPIADFGGRCGEVPLVAFQDICF
jgi:hypothetical protein